MNILNKSVLGVLYYGQESPEKYDMESYKDRQLAERNLHNSKRLDAASLQKAYEDYKKLVDIDFEEFKKMKGL
jgi:hypothetical protein